MGTVKTQVDGRDSSLISSQASFTSPVSPNAAPFRHAASPDLFSQNVGSRSRSFNTSQRNDKFLEEISPHMQPAELGTPGGSVALDDSLPQTTTTILMRGLPAGMSRDALIGMFLFSEDFVDAQFLPREFEAEGALLNALARFGSLDGAYEVRQRLHGKQNATNNGTMLVEILSNGGAESPKMHRKASDAQPNRQLSNSTSSGSSNGGQSARQSRFNKTFMYMDKLSSPTRGQQSFVDRDFQSPDASAALNKLFPPSNRVGNSFLDHRRMSGKAVINDDSADDDETGELIRDPLAFAKNGQKLGPRRASANPSLPTSRMAGLSLNTSNGFGSADMNAIISPTDSTGFASARPSLSLQSPITEMSPNPIATGMSPMSPTGAYQIGSQQIQSRHQYPPANPADQNPPCNTLYVGNLPVDTSEDELKAMFSKQRGYKRLCFRTKHNGPMCFVEFEDITFATKALNELYGQPLHNSVKGGIRLSFSKNPLGVRSGQSNNVGGPQSPLTSPTSAAPFSNVFGAPPGFGGGIAPPPGLSAPPGLNSPIGMASLNHSNAQANSTNMYSHNSPPFTGHQVAQIMSRPGMGGQHVTGGTYMTSPSANTNYSGSGGFPDYLGGR